VALVGADAEFSNNVLIGARANAKKFGLQIVYDKSYPPNTVDYSPIVRAIQATNPDVVLLASYPPDSVGMVRAATEIGLKAQLFGGAMVGMQYASLIGQLSEKLNRVVNYHFFVPSPKMNFPGIEEFLKKYQARAKDRASIRSVSISRHSPTPPWCWSRRSRRPAPSTTTSSPTTSTRIRSRRSSATSGSTSSGMGQRPRDHGAVPERSGSGLEQYMTGHKQVIVYPNDSRTRSAPVREVFAIGGRSRSARSPCGGSARAQLGLLSPLCPPCGEEHTECAALFWSTPTETALEDRRMQIVAAVARGWRLQHRTAGVRRAARGRALVEIVASGCARPTCTGGTVITTRPAGGVRTRGRRHRRNRNEREEFRGQRSRRSVVPWCGACANCGARWSTIARTTSD
jgi:hypothetical protein